MLRDGVGLDVDCKRVIHRVPLDVDEESGLGLRVLGISGMRPAAAAAHKPATPKGL